MPNITAEEFSDLKIMIESKFVAIEENIGYVLLRLDRIGEMNRVISREADTVAAENEKIMESQEEARE